MADQKPRVLLQVALDFVELDRALKVAAEAAAGGADILEAGTPLIKSVGLDAVRRLRAAHPKLIVAADMKVMDAGRIEVESAAKAGAKVVHVLAAASDATIAECVEAGREYGAQIVADLLGTTDPVARAKQVAELGVDFVGVHTAIDMQMRAADPFTQLSEITGAVEAPVCVAGGIHSENAAQAVEAGAAVVIVGGAITKAPDARKATAELKRAITEGVKIPTNLYKRVSGEEIREILMQISAANLSDAMHRRGVLSGLKAVGPGLKMAGPALTVRTAPGDYAKPVEAIDHAKPGEVIVVDAGGVGPAVWGEMATRSAMNRKVAGIVIDGALRDSGDIRALKFPAFSRVICPNAGEPRGLGEIGVSITVAGEVVEPGDWILGDDDGLVRVPRDRVAEWANRGMEVYERESRVREEILQGGTYGELAELEKWEKPR
ncbi:MAG: orotidine 5'-phosphate decarboxylase [Proteobacteria bacterium]|nr:orotidine 5'-phosphate decarboxylase [Pseudomonadota bacterium]